MAMIPHVLIIAGTDPTGGAGIVRDIETTAHFGVRAALAVTSVNTQTDKSVTAIHPLAGRIIEDQMEAAFSTGKIKAVKIGMVATAAIAAGIIRSLKKHPEIPVVYDPVLKASSGGMLAKGNDANMISRKLFSYITILTPNIPELAQLSTSVPAQNEAQILKQVSLLPMPPGTYVLAKGGHIQESQSTDRLYHLPLFPDRKESTMQEFSHPYLDGSMRGTGCILSSAIAANLALGKTMEDSVKIAKDYVYQLMQNHLN